MRTVILGREVENDIDRALVLLCVDSTSASARAKRTF